VFVVDSEAAALDKALAFVDSVLPDLARMVLFLASDDARMCTAREFTVDGGWV
jgi:NAD(P)-dependent dehydrogenase (short-subunit alcohol dehydrogenase family)